MPLATRDGVKLYFEVDGDAAKPAIVLLNSIGTDLALWAAVVPQLVPAYRVLRMDTRGHGRSDVPAGDYALAELARDVVAVMQAASVERATIAGCSLGGMIAMQLAVDAPDRVAALALVCTSATMDSAMWGARIAKVRAEGTAAIADVVMGRFLAPAFADTPIAQSIRRGLVEMSDAGYAGCGAAIRDMKMVDKLPAITAPTLVVAGDRDLSTPYVGHGDRIAGAIRHAKVVHLDCAHLAPIEVPNELAAAIIDSLYTP